MKALSNPTGGLITRSLPRALKKISSNQIPCRPPRGRIFTGLLLVVALAGAALLVSAVAASAEQDLSRNQTGRYRLEQLAIPQPLDHRLPSGPRMEQRAELLIPAGEAAGRPVFFILGNMPDAAPKGLEGLYETYGSPEDMVFILAFHRGYEGSLSLQEDHSRPEYVTPDQALADFHALQQRLAQRFTGPWIVAGFGYGGGLAIEYGIRWPRETAVVVASSGIITAPLATDLYERAIKEHLGPDVHARLADHMANLDPDEMFDDKWLDREMLIAVLHGLVQKPNLKSYQTLMSGATRLPTGMLMATLRGLDSSVGGSQAMKFARSNGKVGLSRTEALTGSWDWRTWRWQQCAGLAGFEVAADPRGAVFTRTLADFCTECRTLFGLDPCGPHRRTLETDVRRLTRPLVFVSGGRDPWAELGLTKDVPSPDNHLHFPKGGHCPDRWDVEVGRKVMARVRALLRAGGADL